ncbi:MAG: threonine/serine dehydratase [Pseudomonadota bacterium]
MSLSATQIAADAADAAARLASYIRKTRLVFSPHFSAATGANVWLKLENLQDTGSFKLRGATNRLLALSELERSRGCITASSGNHGAGVALASKRLGMEGIVFVPEHTSTSKLASIRAYGGEVRLYGTDGLDTEEHARAFALDSDKIFVSPYNDPVVIAGQGSCGVEVVDELPEVDVAFVAIGGGGLVSGVAAVLKQHNPKVRVLGCQPQASPVMTRSIEAGEIVSMDSDSTLSDGTAGGIEDEAITFDLCRALVDDYVLIDERSIADAMVAFIEHEHQLAEGAAGVALAAMLERAEEIRGKNVVVIVCGGNVSANTLRKVLEMTAD